MIKIKGMGTFEREQIFGKKGSFENISDDMESKYTKSKYTEFEYTEFEYTESGEMESEETESEGMESEGTESEEMESEEMESANIQPEDIELKKIEAYINEYNLVTNKITSLSMKFSSGTYVISISLFVGIASIGMASDSVFKNVIYCLMPIMLSFYLFNHIRYMALQFKLSGYAKHLEERINKVLKEQVLLWEGAVARSNGQNGYEGVFWGVIYLNLLVAIYFVAYNNLAIAFYRSQEISDIVLPITILYYYLTAFILFFLLFFTNEHDKAYKKAVASAKAKGPKEDKKTKKEKILGRIKMLIMVIILLLSPSSLLPLIYASKHSVDSVQKVYDYVVVLGNKSIEGQPSEDMQCRLECLMDYIDASPNATIILSGGNGEADCMENYLYSKNMTNYIIIKEGSSQNTYENLKNTMSIVTGNVLVITSDYHVFRTKFIINRLNLDWDILPAKSRSTIIGKALKECYAVYIEYVRGVIKGIG